MKAFILVAIMILTAVPISGRLQDPPVGMRSIKGAWNDKQIQDWYTHASGWIVRTDSLWRSFSVSEMDSAYNHDLAKTKEALLGASNLELVTGVLAKELKSLRSSHFRDLRIFTVVSDDIRDQNIGLILVMDDAERHHGLTVGRMKEMSALIDDGKRLVISADPQRQKIMQWYEERAGIPKW